jgi:TetR/AcrR family transcriptional repressor of nem operon
MARERSFSEPDVLDRLTDVFNTHGYGGTSLALLQEATGLGKQSLYNSFGDKQAMYLQAIACAVQRGARVVALMQAAENGRAGLVQFFDFMVRNCASVNPAENNCIVTSGLLEGIDDAPLASALASGWHRTFDLLCKEVARGQHDGSIANPAPPAELAEVLIALISGLRVAVRAGRSQAQMARLVVMTLGILDLP